jgi:hypothetical protein
MSIADVSPVSLSQAVALTSHEMLWRASLRSGAVILEQPGLSSDHLPRDEVFLMEYLPARQAGLPTVSCKVDLDKGERFVRYWTTIWRNGYGTQRLYVLGVERANRFALIAFYPAFCKIVCSAQKPFQPPWTPDTFALLPVIVRGGPGAGFIEWCQDGFGGRVVSDERQLVMSAVYE